MNEKFDLKKLFVGYLAFSIAFYVLFFFIGNHAAVDKEAVSAALTQKKAMDSEYAEKEDKLNQIKEDISANQTTLDELNQYKSQKEEKTAEIAQLDSDIAAKNSKISELNKNISTKNDELTRLTVGIVTAKSEAKHLPAGEFYVGVDIEPGRYSVTGSSNFAVYSSAGRLKVNTILGKGSYANESYVCSLDSADTIKASSACTYTPVN